MKLSYNWLKDYLEVDASARQIAEAMTSIGIEVDSVEEIEQVPGSLKGVVVARVLECKEHPDSDHLHITKVDDGSGQILTVVCGAPNVAAGQMVLFARIGTSLPGNFKIKKSRIRGVESMGMICAEDELGIGTDHAGIMVLSEEAVVGTSAKDYLGLGSDTVIEYEITANRVDAASHWGVARDLYAYFKLNGIPCELHLPDVSAFEEGEGEGIPVEVTAPDGAPRYMGLTIKGVKAGPSPKWIQDRLISIGLHPINNIVDVSNFVLFELGQPLHTFDADMVKGGKVIVRRATEGEKMVTLDGVERSLLPDDMVIACKEGPMCIAGVFGGKVSGVSDATTNVFLESAYFDPGSIRKTSKAHGLQTDASFRYERGADPLITPYAIRRAALLILQTGGGEIVGKIQEFYPRKIEKKQIELDYNRIEALIGKRIGHETIEKILTYLAYDFVERREGGALVAAPSYMVDVTRECDVVEEILRVYGYNNIELPSGMRVSIAPSPSPDPEAVRNYISDFLAANGFVETMNNSLTKSSYYTGLVTFPEEACVGIVNPLSSDLNVMRQTLIFNALEVVAYNFNRQVSTLRTFEYGSVYRRLQGDGTTLASYEEGQCFTLCMTGPSEKAWRIDTQKGNYFQLKGYLELLVRRFGADLYSMKAEPAPSDIFSEGLSFKLQGSDKIFATIGTICPALSRKFALKHPVFVCEINWQALFSLVKRSNVKFRELPRFPEVRRDLALLLDESVSYEGLYRMAYKTAGKLLKQVTLFDVYRGDKIPQGKKQYALGFVLQDSAKTLTDGEASAAMNKILSSFQREFGAVLR